MRHLRKEHSTLEIPNAPEKPDLETGNDRFEPVKSEKSLYEIEGFSVEINSDVGESESEAECDKDEGMEEEVQDGAQEVMADPERREWIDEI